MFALTGIVVQIELNGVSVPVALDREALAAIGAAIAANAAPADREWPPWMGAQTLARYLDCSVERVHKLVAKRSIPFVQEASGCRIFFERQAIDDWLRRSVQPARGGDA